MGNTKYAYQREDERTAKALAKGIRISRKEAYEVSNALRNLSLDRAKKYLANVLDKKEAIPYKRFNHGVPHRSGIGPGRYPKNTSESFLKLLNEVEANAEAKGLNSTALKITHVATHKARSSYGSFKGSKRLSSHVHIEIVVQETEEKKGKTEAKSKGKKEKAEVKPKVQKEQPKTEEKKVEEKKVEKKPETKPTDKKPEQKETKKEIKK